MATPQSRTMNSSAAAYTAPDFADQSWRSFGMDTEAGRLLNKLYAGTLRKPRVHYPPVRTRKPHPDGAPRPQFIPGGGQVGVDARRKTRADTSKLYVPKVGRGKKPKKIHAVDLITRRKGKKEIFNERDADEVQRMRYRPPLRKPVATDTNKRLLQAQFQFKGGKCLPETGTMQAIEGHLPLQLVTGKQRPSVAAKKRAAILEAENQVPTQAEREDKVLHQLEEDFEEVMNEIEERKTFLDEMLQYGPREHGKHKPEVMAQIAELVRRAKDLDKEIKKRTR